jgi:general secretion pathway protein K
MSAIPQQRLPSNPQSQAGLAILTVLLIISLMVTLLSFLVERQHLLIRRLANQGVSEQGYQYATGVDAWAMRVLHEDENRDVDYLGEDWGGFGQPPEVESDKRRSFSLDLSTQRQRDEVAVVNFGQDVALEYQIKDLNGRFNLNNLANKDKPTRDLQGVIFRHLLEQLQIGEFDERQNLAGSLVDWLDANDTSVGNGFESGDYQSKRTPYFAADQMLTSVGELRFVEGFNQAIINTLKPYVTVLPISNAGININTTSAEVMSSLSNVSVLDKLSVDTFLTLREDPGFLGFQPDQIQAAESAIIGVAPDGSTFIPDMLQTMSNFFQINTRVSLGDYRFCLQTMVFRENPDATTGTAPKVTVLSREHNNICDEIIH